MPPEAYDPEYREPGDQLSPMNRTLEAVTILDKLKRYAPETQWGYDPDLDAIVVPNNKTFRPVPYRLWSQLVESVTPPPQERGAAYVDANKMRVSGMVGAPHESAESRMQQLLEKMLQRGERKPVGP